MNTDPYISDVSQKKYNRSLLAIGFFLGAMLVGFSLSLASAAFDSSDTPRYEKALETHRTNFKAQQEVVDRAKETQFRIKQVMVSTLIDLADSKMQDELAKEEPNRAEVDRLASKSHCYSQVLSLGTLEKEEVDVDTLCDFTMEVASQ